MNISVNIHVEIKCSSFLKICYSVPMSKSMEQRLADARDEVFRRVGSAYKTNQVLGLFRTATYQWTRVPRKHVKKLARITGMAPEQIRPDLYK